MPRPVTLFSGQWADLPFETLCAKAKQFGFDGVELPCWGDHFEVDKALKDKGYCKSRWDILKSHGLKTFAISNYLVGQAVCDNIDERYKAILPKDVWGDGSPAGVQRRAAQKMIDTARAARALFHAAPEKSPFPVTVSGFIGSSVWHSIHAFPPTNHEYCQKGFDDFAKKWTPILNEFDKVNVRFALEVHPAGIAFDLASAQHAIDAIKGHKRFGFNYDPSHLGYHRVDCVKFIRMFADRIFHVHINDAWWGHGDGTVGVFGGHTTFADPARYWDFRSPRHGDVKFEDIIVALNDIKYNGPLSVEWEDSRMDREHGAAEAAAFARRPSPTRRRWRKIDSKPSSISVDAQFDRLPSGRSNQTRDSFVNPKCRLFYLLSIPIALVGWIVGASLLHCLASPGSIIFIFSLAQLMKYMMCNWLSTPRERATRLRKQRQLIELIRMMRPQRQA